MTDTLVALLSSLVTGMSVLVAIWIYRRTEDQRTFAAFRLSLVDLRQNIRELDGLLGEPFFVEMGLAISDELRQLFPTRPSKDELKQYVIDERHQGFIGQAIHTGRLRSSTLKRCEKLIAEIERSPYVYREQLPVVSHLLFLLSTYILRTAQTASAPRLFDEIIGKPGQFVNLAKDKFDTDEVTDAEAFRYIGLMLAMAPSAYMEAKGQKVVTHAEKLMIVVVERYTGMADKELRKHGRRQRRMRKKVEEIDQATHLKDAFECFKLIRDLFDQDLWDSIVENVTKLDQQAHGGD